MAKIILTDRLVKNFSGSAYGACLVSADSLILNNLLLELGC